MQLNILKTTVSKHIIDGLCLVVFNSVYIIIIYSIHYIVYTKHLNTKYYMVTCKRKKHVYNKMKSNVYDKIKSTRFFSLSCIVCLGFVFRCLVSLLLSNTPNITKHKTPPDNENKMFTFLDSIVW